MRIKDILSLIATFLKHITAFQQFELLFFKQDAKDVYLIFLPQAQIIWKQNHLINNLAVAQQNILMYMDTLYISKFAYIKYELYSLYTYIVSMTHTQEDFSL